MIYLAILDNETMYIFRLSALWPHVLSKYKISKHNFVLTCARGLIV